MPGLVGYTGHLVTGVWIGNDDNSPMNKATGGGFPVDIWARFMKDAHEGVPTGFCADSHVRASCLCTASHARSRLPGIFSGVARR